VAAAIHIPLTLKKIIWDRELFFFRKGVYPSAAAADWAIRAVARPQTLPPGGTEDPLPFPASRLALVLRSATVEMGSAADPDRRHPDRGTWSTASRPECRARRRPAPKASGAMPTIHLPLGQTLPSPPSPAMPHLLIFRAMPDNTPLPHD